MNIENIKKMEEYLFYLEWAKGGGEIPKKSYVDWTGVTVMSYEDWLEKQSNNEHFEPNE